MTEANDPYLWLEEAEGERPLSWSREQTARSLQELEADPIYAALKDKARPDDDKSIPGVWFERDEILLHFLQDQTHRRGLLRRTTLDSFITAEPEWQAVFDLDHEAETCGRDWNWSRMVWGGSQARSPDRQCLILPLAEGGADANELYEIDLQTGRFREDGFFLPKSQQHAAYIHDDTLLVARDWGPGTLTQPGFPFVLKRLKRGQALEDAEELYRGEPGDMGVEPRVLRYEDDSLATIVAERWMARYQRQFHLVTDTNSVQIAVPEQSYLYCLFHGMLIFGCARTGPSTI